jgi:hypothetical protein
MTANGPLVHFAGSRIRFDTPHPGLLTAIHTHFRHCLTEGGDVIASYQVASAADSDFSITRDGSELPSRLSFEAALRHLMQDGLTQLNGASKTHLIFHAAALADADRGVLRQRAAVESQPLPPAWRRRFSASDRRRHRAAERRRERSAACRSLVLKKGSDFIWQRPA